MDMFLFGLSVELWIYIFVILLFGMSMDVFLFRLWIHSYGLIAWDEYSSNLVVKDEYGSMVLFVTVSI